MKGTSRRRWRTQWNKNKGKGERREHELACKKKSRSVTFCSYVIFILDLRGIFFTVVFEATLFPWSRFSWFLTDNKSIDTQTNKQKDTELWCERSPNVSTLTVVSLGFGRVGCWTSQVTLSSSCRWVGKCRMLVWVNVPFEWAVMLFSLTARKGSAGVTPLISQLIWDVGRPPMAEHDTDWKWVPFMVNAFTWTSTSGRAVHG